MEVLTAILVAITAFYAFATHRMANEMKEARGIAVLPKVMPSMRYLTEDVAMPTIINVGPGAALAVKIEMWLEPGKGHAREWTTPVLAPNQEHQFFLKDGNTWASMEKVLESYTTLCVKGSCRDALGRSHDIDERILILTGGSCC